MAELDLPPTPRQCEVLRLIAEHSRAHGHAPTIAELGHGLGIASTNGVAAHLKALNRRGLLTWRPHRARTLVLTTAARSLLGLAAAALLLFSGCELRREVDLVHADGCVAFCERIGMRVALVSKGDCLCAPPGPACESAWTRAELGLELLGDCRAALASCTARGDR